MPKLDFKETLSLAQVNKACNAAVWNEHGVVCLKDKMKIKGYQMLPMLWAAHQGNLPAVKALIQAGEDVDEIGNHYRDSHALSGPDRHVPEQTALQLAATSGHSKVVGFLIDEGANLHLRGGIEKRTALVVLAILDTPWSARDCCSKRAQMLMRGIDDMVTPLIICSDNRKSAIPNMQLLLKHGANVNCASLQIDHFAGNTALHRASYHGIEQTVTALLESRCARRCKKFGWQDSAVLRCFSKSVPHRRRVVERRSQCVSSRSCPFDLFEGTHKVQERTCRTL